MKVREALGTATQRLTSSDTQRLDAELLMAEALGISREALLLAHLEDEAPSAFESLLGRRLAGEPVAYITGRRAFWTIELDVGPGVLIPRPDSETLIEAALAHFGAEGPGTILDLGTGPGTLLLAALDQWPNARGLGVDLSERALAVAAANAGRLGLAGRASFRLGDWSEGIRERFDLILCNPPYIERNAQLPRDVADWEPHEALFAGPDGLDDYRRLAPMTPLLLGAGGIACIELGAGQESAVSALFIAEGLNTRFRNDLGGHARCLIVSA
jgi:release factor glutamine methyltransferase